MQPLKIRLKIGDEFGSVAKKKNIYIFTLFNLITL